MSTPERTAVLTGIIFAAGVAFIAFSPFSPHFANARSYSAGALCPATGLDKGLVPSRANGRANNKLRCDALTRAQNGRLEFLNQRTKAVEARSYALQSH